MAEKDIFKVEIQGLSEIEEALKNLEPFLQDKVLRNVNKEAVQKYVVQPLRDSVVYSPKTESRIRVATAAYSYENDKTLAIGGVTGQAFWVRFAQRGTAERFTKEGVSKGRIVGKNLMQPIILNSVDDIIKFASEGYGDAVEKELKKQLKSTTAKLAKK